MLHNGYNIGSTMILPGLTFKYQPTPQMDSQICRNIQLSLDNY